MICFQGAGIYQVSPIQAVHVSHSVSLLLHSECSHSQLPRRLADSGSLSGTVVQHRYLVLRHLTRLGLQVNWEKTKLSPMHKISFLGVEIDLIAMFVQLTSSVTAKLPEPIRGQGGGLKFFQRLLGHIASAAGVTLFSLLHMRPLQHWLQQGMY